MQLSNFNTVAQRKKYFNDGGIVFLKRNLDPLRKSTFSFKVREGNYPDVLIGLERPEPKHVFFVDLKSGLKAETEG